MQKATITVLAAVLIFCALIGGFLLELFRFAGKPGGTDINVQVVNVPPGQGSKATAADLYARGIITNAFKFNLYARIKGYDKQIKAGEYRLAPSYSPKQIFNIIVSGKVRLYKITIPEGYNLAQIAAMMPAAGLGPAEDFLKTAHKGSLVREYNIPGDSFEGYLFPDTYHFPKGVSADKIIQTLVRRFREVFIAEWEKRAREKQLTVHQVVTLASIIEKETGEPSERSIISSVFHNRLKKNMRLASDPTVIYGIKGFNGNLTRKDLRTLTPYNTYKIKGLPPGPIANPGAKAIKAALYPAKTNYLYFVSKKDGTHQFSTNFKDHEKAIRKYQLRR
ncbi:MAG: endolytic transglycosylase MltG [Deltaproteobacteria bacterium]|nr:endolytic transglycosylase MltG [Deltaproteobacteria bacterium]